MKSDPNANEARGLGIPHPTHHLKDMENFNYAGAAELFASKSERLRGRTVTYRRYATGAEALRFAIEELPAALLPGTIIETDEARFDHKQIRILYDSVNYPLKRRARPKSPR